MASQRSYKCTFSDCEWSTKGFPDAWKLNRHLRSHGNASKPSTNSSSADCDPVEESDFFQVEFVVGTKMVGRKRQYYVKWFGNDEVTWEPSGNLTSACSRAINLFKEKMGWQKLPVDNTVYVLPNYQKPATVHRSSASHRGRKRKSAKVQKQDPTVKKLNVAHGYSDVASDNATNNAEEVAVDFKADKGYQPYVKGPRTPAPSSPVKDESSTVDTNDPAFSDYFSRVFSSPLRAKALDVFKEKSGLQVLPVDHEESCYETAADPEQEKPSHDDSGFVSEDLASVASEPDEFETPAGDDRSPTVSRCATPMPTSPAKNEHWFNANFNVDLVCPFPERLLTVPSTTDTARAFASMSDFRKHMCASLAVPLFGNACSRLYTDYNERRNNPYSLPR